MYLRGTLFWEHADGQGWTEHYYFNLSTHSAAETPLTNMANFRLAMQPATVELKGARVSNIDRARDSIPFDLSGPGTYAPATGGVDLYPSVAIQILLGATPSIKNRMFMRSWTSDNISGDVQNFQAAMITAYDNWASGVLANACQTLTKVSGIATLTPINTVIPERVTTRRTGRPFGLPAGRHRRR